MQDNARSAARDADDIDGENGCGYDVCVAGAC
jgi:hypothetical protein